MNHRRLVDQNDDRSLYEVLDAEGGHVGWDEEPANPAPDQAAAVTQAAALIAQQVDPAQPDPNQADLVHALCVLAAADPMLQAVMPQTAAATTPPPDQPEPPAPGPAPGS